MKRIIILSLLLLAPGAGYQVFRENTHSLDQDLNDYYSFVEEYSNDSGMWPVFRFGGEEIIQSRAPGMALRKWFLEKDLGTIRLGAEGIYPDYATRQENGKVKVGGKGFIDEYCDNPTGYVGPLDQEIVSRTFLPDGYELVRAPENYSITSPHLSLSYTASAHGNKLVETIRFKVKERIPGGLYCLERGDLEKPLKQGWIIKRKGVPALTKEKVFLVFAVSTAFGIAVIAGVIIALRRYNNEKDRE